MLDRHYIEATPTKVLNNLSQSNWTVQLWSVSRISEEYASTPIFITTDLENCSLNRAIPLPMNTVITMVLKVGQTLWAITDDHGLLATSVIKGN